MVGSMSFNSSFLTSHLQVDREMQTDLEPSRSLRRRIRKGK